MKPSFKRTANMLVILFVPLLIWLFLVCFVVSGKWIGGLFFVALILQFVWWGAIFVSIKKGDQARGRWDTRNFLFVIRRIVILFIPAITFAIFKSLGLVELSKTWIWIFGLWQVGSIIYQILKGKNKIGKNDPYRQDELDELKGVR